MKLPNPIELRERILDWWYRHGGWRNPMIWLIVMLLVIWQLWIRWMPLMRELSTIYYRFDHKIRLFFIGDWLRSGSFLNGVFVFNTVLLFGWVFTVIFTYHDARARFDRGWYWAGIAFFFPFAGLFFYLMYRNSSLADMDLMDIDTGYMDAHSWALQDLEERKANERRARLEHMIKVRQSNLRERFPKRIFSPKYWIERLMLWVDEGDPRKQTERRRQETAKQLIRIPKSAVKREKIATVKQLRGKLKYYKRMSDLANMPREDEDIDTLISDGNNSEALDLLRERLLIAREMSDGKGESTYKHYLDRFSNAGIISIEQAQQIDEECMPAQLIDEELDSIEITDPTSDQTIVQLDSDTRTDLTPLAPE